MPRALLSRASEHTPAPEASSFTLPQSGKLTSEEGVGADILGDDHDGRLTMDMVGSMHEVRSQLVNVVPPGNVGGLSDRFT